VTAQKQVVYPSTGAFSGTSQLNLGPFTAGPVFKLLQARLRGQVNFQGATLGATSVLANVILYGVQYGVHGFTPADVVTSAYDATWLIRQQLGHSDFITSWAPPTSSAPVIASLGLEGWWAGQQYINSTIDYYLSLRAPTGVAVANFNLYGSIEIWFV